MDGCDKRELGCPAEKVPQKEPGKPKSQLALVHFLMSTDVRPQTPLQLPVTGVEEPVCPLRSCLLVEKVLLSSP